MIVKRHVPIRSTKLRWMKLFNGHDDPSLDRNLVDTDFYNKVKVWNDRHLHGYYAWKPFIIYDLLQTCGIW